MGLWSLGLAYINPGTGSLIVQVLVMGLAGVVLGLRGAWCRLKGLMRGRK